MPTARAYKRRPGAKFIKRVEETEQQRFITWFKRTFPGVIIYTDFAAGLHLSNNERIKMMQQRSRRGMPDVHIDHPMTHIIDGKQVVFHGAKFEFKKTGEPIYKKDGVTLRKSSYKHVYFKNGREIIYEGDHLQEQADTLMAYNQAGYYGRFVVGMVEAQRHARWFMNVPEQQTLDLSLDPDY